MRTVACLLAGLIATGVAPATALAESASARMQVSARVLPHVRLAPERVRLRFQPRAAYARSITIEGFGAAVLLRDEPVELSLAPARDLSFTLRLWLAPGFEPGDYPSPVQVFAVVD